MRGDIPHYGRKKEHYVGYLARFEFLKAFNDHKVRIHEAFMAIGRLYDPSREAVVNSDVHFEEVSIRE